MWIPLNHCWYFFFCYPWSLLFCCSGWNLTVRNVFHREIAGRLRLGLATIWLDIYRFVHPAFILKIAGKKAIFLLTGISQYQFTIRKFTCYGNSSIPKNNQFTLK